MMFLLPALIALIEAPLGLPVTVDYGTPAGYAMGEVLSGESYSVVEQAGGLVTLVPLLLDTLSLPDVRATFGEDTLLLAGPVLMVRPMIPDTSLSPAFFPAPAIMSIPPGYPLDYLRQRAFWLVWGGPPGFPWIPVAVGVVLLGALTVLLASRRRKAYTGEEAEEARKVPADSRVLLLLESEAFVHGHWKALYAQMEVLFRALVASRFGLGNPALTLYQIERMLAREMKAGKFVERARPLMREIVLQIYANRGSTREKSRGFIETLAELTRGEGRA